LRSQTIEEIPPRNKHGEISEKTEQYLCSTVHSLKGQ
jgi:hypothetical protein